MLPLTTAKLHLLVQPNRRFLILSLAMGPVVNSRDIGVLIAIAIRPCPPALGSSRALRLLP